MAEPLLPVHTVTELVEASAGSALIRLEWADPLSGPAWRCGRAVLATRRTTWRGTGVLVLGPPDDVAALAAHVVEDGPLTRTGARSATVERSSFAAFAQHVPLDETGGDWEWMCTFASPARAAAEDRLEPLSRDDETEIRALLVLANSRTEARPFETADQTWVGARDRHGALVACGVRGPGPTGIPALAGITVAPTHRRTGLGVAVTARLTRDAVAETGACVLGMYSDNDVARRVYLGLGYGHVHAFRSRLLPT